MKAIVIFCVLVLNIYIISAAKSPGPLFMWSDKEIFTSSRISVGYANSDAVEELLENIASISNNKGSLNKHLSKDIPFPEVIAIFLKPHLTSSKFSVWANVYNQKQKNGGALANLKNLYDNSKSSLSIHYSYLKDSFASDILTTFSEKLSKTYPKSNSVVFSDNKNDKNHFPLVNSKWVSISDAEEYLVTGEGKKYFHNGEPELFVFYFSHEESTEVVSAEDGIMGTISNIINVATNNNYLAVFSSDVTEEHTYPSIKHGKQSVFRTEFVRNLKATNGTSDIAGTFFPPQIFQAIIVVFVLLGGLFAGIYNTAYLQTPPKLLDEAMAKKKNK